MVEHRVPEHEVEALLGERQRLGVGTRRPHLQAEAGGVRRERADHAGRDVGAGRLRDHTGLEQVQREVARAGADLQRAFEAPVEPRAEHLAQLAEHLGLADLAEVDAPLGVIARRGNVVIARVYVADFVRGP